MRARTGVGVWLVVGVVFATLLSGLGASGFLPGSASGAHPTEAPHAAGQVLGKTVIVAPATLTSPNPQSQGQFGYSVALSGSRLVVGAPLERGMGCNYAGIVYVISPKTGLTIELTSPHSQFEGHFGTSVAVSGKRVVVGAPIENASGHRAAGHAYVFDMRTGLVLELSSPNAQFDGYFGNAVGISGKRVVVGAYNENASAYSQAGHAYTFDATTGALISTLASPNAQVDGYFGTSVGISGKRLVVGAPFETAGAEIEAGHAYTFAAPTGASMSNLTSPSPSTAGHFGSSVAISGKKVIVGAPGETYLAHPYGGHAYTFVASTGTLLSTLASLNPENGSYFGAAVAISGKRVVVGAYSETVSASAGAGRAYTFLATTGAPIATFASPNPQTTGRFGWSTAISGTRVFVGAVAETAPSSGVQHDGNAYLLTT